MRNNNTVKMNPKQTVRNPHPIIESSFLVFNSACNPLLERCTGAKGHGNVTSVLSRLAALGGKIVVPDEVGLSRVVGVRREMGNSAVTVGSFHTDTSVITSAVGTIDATIRAEVDAVDERDVVPQGVGNRVLELGDTVGPHQVGVLGDLERSMASHALAPRSASRNRSLSVGERTPVSLVSIAYMTGIIPSYRTVTS